MNNNHRFSSIFTIYVILLVIVNFNYVSASLESIKESSLFNDIHKKLSANDQEIEELSKKLELRSKSYQNNNLTSSIPYRKLYDKLPPFKLENLKQSGEAISYHENCKISVPKSTNNIKEQINYHFISSNGEYFIFVNNNISRTLSIYDFNCTLLTKINNLSVKFIIEEEKPASKSGFSSNTKDAAESQYIFAMSDINELIKIDLTLIKAYYIESKSQKSPSNKPNFYHVLNNKVISSGEKEEIIGVLMKTLHNNQQSRTKEDRTSPSYAQKSFIIVLDSSEIKIYDESGALKLTMKEPSAIDELYEELNGKDAMEGKRNDKSLQLVNHHPYPLLLENNWIYFVDTSKYIRQPWNCPYIPNVRKIFVENIHSNEVYILTEEKILKFNVKAKDSRDSKKGQCELEKTISYFDPFMKNKKPDEITFSVHKNLIFLDNLVYNMTSNEYLKVFMASLVSENRIKWSEKTCDQLSLQYIPFALLAEKKLSTEKHYTISFLCKSDTSEELHLFSVTQTKPESSVFIYIIFAFLLVIFFAVKFFKSSGPNYEKEMLYPYDFNLEEKEIRKEHYDQLYKYMDQAKKVEKEEKSKNEEKEPKQKSFQSNKKEKNKKE